jgi:hypothetical protein
MAIRGLARLFVDTYMYTQFILIFRFFVRTKEAQLESQNKIMQLQSIVVIYFVYILFILNVLYRLCSLFYWSYYKLRQYYNSVTPTDELLFKIFFYTYLLTLNFINCSALQYLFYYQGRKLQGRTKNPKAKVASDQLKIKDFAEHSLDIKNITNNSNILMGRHSSNY